MRDYTLIAVNIFIAVLICIIIAILVVDISKDTSNLPDCESRNDTRSRYEGGTGIGIGLDMSSGKMKLGYGIGPVNIISF